MFDSTKKSYTFKEDLARLRDKVHDVWRDVVLRDDRGPVKEMCPTFKISHLAIGLSIKRTVSVDWRIQRGLDACRSMFLCLALENRAK